MKRQHYPSERAAPVACLEALIEAAQRREWENAQERKRGTRLPKRDSASLQRGHSERHILSNE